MAAREHNETGLRGPENRNTRPLALSTVTSATEHKGKKPFASELALQGLSHLLGGAGGLLSGR